MNPNCTIAVIQPTDMAKEIPDAGLAISAFGTNQTETHANCARTTRKRTEVRFILPVPNHELRPGPPEIHAHHTLDVTNVTSA